MTRIIFAIISLAGQVLWLITPKLASSSNPFSALSRYSIIALPVFLILSKIFYGSRLVASDWKMGALYVIGGGTGVITYILATKHGGSIAGVASILQLAIIGASIISYFVFQERINTTQAIGIALLCVGSIMVLGFSNK